MDSAFGEAGSGGQTDFSMARKTSPPGRWIEWADVTISKFRARRIRIYVPAKHEKSRTRAALYMFDGQNVFGDEGSFAGGWFAHDAVDRLSPDGYNVPLIVAIDNTPERMDELSAWKMGNMGGRAEDFVNALAEDVVGRVQREFSLEPGAVGSVVAGSSMGGLGALYAHFRRPDAFGGALCMSPSFFAGRGAFLQFLEGQPNPMFSRVYIDCGAKEGGGRMMRVAEQVADKLRARGYADDRVMWRPDSRGTHNEKHWRRRLPKAVRFMFRH